MTGRPTPQACSFQLLCVLCGPHKRADEEAGWPSGLAHASKGVYKINLLSHRRFNFHVHFPYVPSAALSNAQASPKLSKISQPQSCSGKIGGRRSEYKSGITVWPPPLVKFYWAILLLIPVVVYLFVYFTLESAQSISFLPKTGHISKCLCQRLVPNCV